MSIGQLDSIITSSADKSWYGVIEAFCTGVKSPDVYLGRESGSILEKDEKSGSFACAERSVVLLCC